MTKFRLPSIALGVALGGCAVDDTDDGFEPPRTLRLELDSFVAPSGKEGLKCQSFANPFGEPIDVVVWTADLDETGHHMLAFLVDGGEDTPLADCAGVDNATALAFQSQSAGTSTLRYPEGVAVRIQPDQTLQVQVHWLNATIDPIEVTNALELELAEPGMVGRELGQLHFDNLDVHVPIGGEATSSKICTLDRDVDLVWLTSHMHSRGIGFEARVDDEVLYATSGWDDPPTGVWTPPKRVRAGQQITFSCTYRNTTDHELDFGPSLENDEMCVLVGAYLPVDGGSNELLSCATHAPGECLACAEAVMGGDPALLCTDGAASARDAYDALQACTCGADTCADACAASACAGGLPDDECMSCVQTTCADAVSACFV